LGNGAHPRHNFAAKRLRSGEGRVSGDGGIDFAERLEKVSRRERFARIRKM